MVTVSYAPRLATWCEEGGPWLRERLRESLLERLDDIGELLEAVGVRVLGADFGRD